LVEKTSLPTTIILAILVTILETPCSLPIYVGTVTILNYSGFSLPLILAYFAYYNFLFILPLIVILFLVWRGREMVSLKDWEHKAKKWMKLSLGIFLVLMGSWLLV
jgi:cytochrome c biogenesis protein CcdA